MKALVGAFNQEKALVGAFSVIVQPVVEPMEHYTALIITWSPSRLGRRGQRAWQTQYAPYSLYAIVQARISRHSLL